MKTNRIINSRFKGIYKKHNSLAIPLQYKVVYLWAVTQTLRTSKQHAHFEPLPILQSLLDNFTQ